MVPQDTNALLVTEEFLETELGDKMWYKRAPKVDTMCCLGFACLALGLTRGLSYQIGYRWLNTDFATSAARENDSPNTDEAREDNLRLLAMDNGFEFEFVN